MSKVLKAFQIQADACEPMGSAFTAGLCRVFVENLDHSTKVGAFCLNWKGDPTPSADSIPLRICGGLHALVLSGRDDELASHYPPHKSMAPSWDVVNSVLQRHEEFLLHWMESPPQTNEVSRSAVIWPALMAIASRVNRPLKLLEIGASGGLNLQANQYGYDLGGVTCGTLSSALQLKPEWRGQRPIVASPEIVCREGCDLSPLDVRSHEDVLRLRSYVWPDQADRNARMDAALSIANQSPFTIEKADAVEWLERKLARLEPGVCTVIYSTIAWQYLPHEAKEVGEGVIIKASREASTNGTHLAWLRFEADNETPGAGVRLQMWPDRSDIKLGRADFHARWVDWRGLQ